MNRLRTGFTVVELLVTLGVIAVLTGLLLPAINLAREATRRSGCQNNLRQLGVAVQLHVDKLRQFPGNGGFVPDNTIQSVDGQSTGIWTRDFELGTQFKWGIGDPAAPADRQPGSWAYSLLPHVEQTQAYLDRDFRQVPPLYLCPTRGRRNFGVPATDWFGTYESGGWAWTKTDYCGNLKLMPDLPRVVYPGAVTDGLSQTLAIGEKAFDPSVQTPVSWYWDEPLFSGGSKGTARAGEKIVADGPGIDFKENWGSAHRGGAVFVAADGSTRFVSESIEPQILRALLTPDRADHESLSPAQE